ncbi:MAG TPA: ATP-binding protein, partial [Longimicrobiales bacterium]|nr:ATP-binding protein [Longimicrobiales bacterium]
GDADVQIEAGVWLDELFTQAPLKVAESVVVFPRGQETAYFSTTCSTLEEGVPPALTATMGRNGQLPFELDGEGRLASFVTMETLPWSVVAHARTDTFLAPLQQLQASYWIFVLTLALATGLAFSLLLDRVVMSLEDLTAAAARIGEGELNPWLPPPGNDEVGRLSLAFSGMLERIRQMMQRVDQSGRLAVVGQLTSYLAHEIRNPLSSIRMNLQSLQRDVRRGRIPEESGEAIEISLREVDRLSSSVTSVLQLGRPVTGPRETVSLHDVVEDAAELLNGEFRRARVSLELGLDASADRVVAATGQLKGVFLNLMMNALEAQSNGGGRVEVRSRLVSSHGDGPTVAIHIRDYGRGIPPDLRTRVFEPFFTTKNQGSGIGLAMALRTVREHGGDVFLAELPESAEGTEFVVALPLAAVVADSVPEPSVDLPPWMDADSRVGPTDPAWSKRRAAKDAQGPVRKIDDAHIRALVELSDSDHGELH